MKKCDHTWYMREEGIQCTKCLIIWDKSMDIKDYTILPEPLIDPAPSIPLGITYISQRKDPGG